MTKQSMYVLLKVTFQKVRWWKGMFGQTLRLWGTDTGFLSFCYSCRDSRTASFRGVVHNKLWWRLLQNGDLSHSVCIFKWFCMALYVWQLWKYAFQISLQKRIFFKSKLVYSIRFLYPQDLLLPGSKSYHTYSGCP